jgi:GNAT superfamily N-acetyltransferase
MGLPPGTAGESRSDRAAGDGSGEHQGCSRIPWRRSGRSWYADEADRRLTWLAELDDRPVGFTDLTISVRRPRPGRAAVRWGYLDSAFVLAAHRHQGIGRRLLDALLDDATRNRIAAIMLHPTADAIRFYERAGFDLIPADTKGRMFKTIKAP